MTVPSSGCSSQMFVLSHSDSNYLGLLLKMRSLLMILIIGSSVGEKFTLEDAIEPSSAYRRIMKRASLEEIDDPEDSGPSISGFFKFINRKVFGDDLEEKVGENGPPFVGFIGYLTSKMFGSTNTTDPVLLDDLESLESTNDIRKEAVVTTAVPVAQEALLDDPVVRTVIGMTLGGLVWQYLFPPYNTLTVTARRRKRSDDWYFSISRESFFHVLGGGRLSFSDLSHLSKKIDQD